MSDKRTDAFTELGHAVLDARHNGTSPERAEAARLTLLGNLPSLPPNVEAMIRTDFVEVPMVAISQGGKIAFLGIMSGGRRYQHICEWDSVDKKMDLVDHGFAGFVNHLHYPQDSEDVAFTVTNHDGKTSVYWGDWKFDANTDELGKVVGIYCYLLDEGPHYWPHCVVTYQSGGKQYIQTFKKGGGGRTYGTDQLIEKVRAKRLKVLGHRPEGQFIILATSAKSRQSIILLDLKEIQYWESDQYDQILEDSVMEREGKFSFVGFNKVYPDYDDVSGLLGGTGNLFMVEPGSEEKITSCVLPGNVHCLPSGRILIHGYGKDIFLLEVGTNDPINIPGAKGIRHILEIEAGLVVHAITHSDLHVLLVVHENWDSVPGVLSIYADGEVSNLRYWSGHLVFKAGDGLGVISVANLENWLVESDDDAYSDSIGYYPLYTPFERLVPTNEGILSWHFVNGTFYIIRYPL